MTGSWLCRDDLDRERLLDMERHLRPMRAITMGLIAATVLATAGFVSLEVMVTAVIGVVLAFGMFWLADLKLSDSERPEYLMFAAWTGAQVVIAACVIVTGGPDSPGVAWLAIPIVTLSSRFSTRGVLVGLAISLLLLIIATFGVDPAAVIDKPTLFSAPAVVIVSIAILSIALMRSDLYHRGAAVIDPLTGMLNRKALANRIVELTQQSEYTGQPVGLIVGDLDHFKRVNDSLGHATGDAVLTDLAYLLRKRLRAFDLAYRIGGEEFLVMLPGADAEEARRMAEELRTAIEEDTLGGGVEMTMSFGVSASVPGSEFDYNRVFAAADGALYEAKRLGRNRVCQISPAPPTTEPEPLPQPADQLAH
jgi:diguanylate cyclase (GGDEF)-like protein